MNAPLIIAHRGLHGLGIATENTMKAFRRAIDLRANAIELDVRMTADNVPVVIHDETLARIVTCPKQVRDVTLEEIKTYHTLDSQQIPTLAEVLGSINPEVLMLVELKDQWSDEQLESLLKVINHQQDSAKRCIVIGFDHKTLRRLKAKNAEIRIGFSFENSLSEALLQEAKDASAEAIIPNVKLLDEHVIEEAHQRHLRVFPWTCNFDDDIQKSIDLGVDGIITDNVMQTRELISNSNRSISRTQVGMGA